MCSKRRTLQRHRMESHHSNARIFNCKERQGLIVVQVEFRPLWESSRAEPFFRRTEGPPSEMSVARSLGPFVKARAFGKTPWLLYWNSNCTTTPGFEKTRRNEGLNWCTFGPAVPRSLCAEHLLLHRSMGLVDRGVCVCACRGIGVCNGDSTELLAADHTRAFLGRPLRVK